MNFKIPTLKSRWHLIGECTLESDQIFSLFFLFPKSMLNTLPLLEIYAE